MVLILIRGIPGSGKSTFAKQLSKEIPAPMFEADMFFETKDGYKLDETKLRFAHEFCFNNVKKALENHKDCIVANTFSRFREIKPYLDLGHEYNATIMIYRMSGHYQNVHNVPDETVKKIENRFVDIPDEIII